MDTANEEYREALAQAGQLYLPTPDSKLMLNRGPTEGITRSAGGCTGTGFKGKPVKSYKFAVDDMTVHGQREEGMVER